MERDRDQVRREIEETKAAMAAKLGEITERVEGARSKIESVREQLSVRHQVEVRPWTMFGLSVLAGFALHRFVHSRRVESAVSSALQGARSTAQEVAGQAARAARRAARMARSGAGVIREQVFEGDYHPLRRVAMDAVTRTVVSTVAGAVAGAIVNRVVSSRGEDQQPGERREVNPYESVEISPPVSPRVPQHMEERF